MDQFSPHSLVQRMIVLAGYKTIKEALVNRGKEFGDRDISPLFYDYDEGHGNMSTSNH